MEVSTWCQADKPPGGSLFCKRLGKPKILEKVLANTQKETEEKKEETFLTTEEHR